VAKDLVARGAQQTPDESRLVVVVYGQLLADSLGSLADEAGAALSGV
jgi:hypothetical protein